MSNGAFIIYNALGFGLLCYLVFYYFRKEKIRKNGLPADGEIINFESDHDGGRLPIIKFKTLSGELIEKKYDSTVRSKYKIGDTVQIIYDPSKPVNFVIDSPWERGMNILFIVIAVLAFLSILFLPGKI
ncbi:MAG TPA: DUF3592 domain-containing protein [Chitinophagaceae bacterium]